MTEHPYRPFFRRYYFSVYLLFPLMLICSMTGMDLCMILLFLGWIAERLLSPDRVHEDRELAAVVGSFLLVLLVPEVINFSWRGLSELVVHHYRKVFLIFLVVSTLRSLDMLEWSMRVYVGLAALASLITVGAYVSGWPVLQRFLEGGIVRPDGWLRGRYRGSGPGHWKSIQFANVMAFVFPFAFALFWRSLNRRSWKKSFFYGSCVVSLFGGVVVSLSRMPMVALLGFLVVGFGVWAFRRLRGREWKLGARASFHEGIVPVLLVGLIVVGLLVSGLMSRQVRNRVMNVASGSALGPRLEMWRAVYQHTVSHPREMILGAGTERGVDHFRRVKERPVSMLDEEGFQHAHNNFVQYFLDYGILGPVAYVGLWVFLLRRVWSMPAQSPWWVYRFGGLGLIFVFNVCGLTEFNWGRSITHYNVAFGMGVVLAACRLVRREGEC